MHPNPLSAPRTAASLAFAALVALGAHAARAQAPSPAPKAPAPVPTLRPIRLGAWTLSGSARVRQESWNWFAPKDPKFDPNYTFTGATLRLAAARPLPGKKGSEVKIELQQSGLVGLPKSSLAPAPQGALGLGATYRAVNGAQTGRLFLKQAYVALPVGTGALVKAGRFEFADGAETAPPVPTLAAVKKQRVAERLIGPFAWTHVGRSFDAASYSASAPAGNLTLVAGYPTRGVFDVDGGDTLTSVRFGYVAATRNHYAKTTRLPGEERLLVMLYDDSRKSVTKTDNLPAIAKDRDSIKITTLGGHVLRALPGGFDALLWGALQSGDWGKKKHRAFAFAAETGYKPRAGRKIDLWLRLGYDRYSGDGNAADGTHSTFYPLLNTPRIYARTPFFAEANARDLFFQVQAKPNAKLALRADYHKIALDNKNDLWYQAGGPFEPGGNFGLVGRKGSGGALADLADLSADLTLDKSTTASLYVGRMLGKSVVRSIYPSSAGTFGYGEITVKF